MQDIPSDWKVPIWYIYLYIYRFHIATLKLPMSSCDVRLVDLRQRVWSARCHWHRFKRTTGSTVDWIHRDRRPTTSYSGFSTSWMAIDPKPHTVKINCGNRIATIKLDSSLKYTNLWLGKEEKGWFVFILQPKQRAKMESRWRSKHITVSN